jgi:hypothetical protein
MTSCQGSGIDELQPSVKSTLPRLVAIGDPDSRRRTKINRERKCGCVPTLLLVAGEGRPSAPQMQSVARHVTRDLVEHDSKGRL